MPSNLDTMPAVMRQHESRARRREAARMHYEGYSWGEVAERLNFATKGGAVNAAKRFLDRAAKTDPIADRRMLVESARGDLRDLDDGKRQARDRGDDENVQRYAQVKTKVRDQLARLVGANAPTQAEVSVTVSATELRERVRVAAERADADRVALPAAPAAAVVDAELVGDPERSEHAEGVRR